MVVDFMWTCCVFISMVIIKVLVMLFELCGDRLHHRLMTPPDLRIVD